MTLSVVAAAARVSKATASNVFSRPERVRPALRQHVEEIARALGYSGPDPRGRMLSSGRVNAIGVVPPASFGISLFFKSGFSRGFLAGVAKVCEERDVGLSLVSGRADQLAWGIGTAIVDGFILNSVEQLEFIAPNKRGRLPVVVVGPAAGAGLSTVAAAGREGTRLMTEHLLGLGHRRFIVASLLEAFRAPVFHAPGGNRALVSAQAFTLEQLAGVDDALRAAGLSLDAMPLLEACGTPAEEAAFGNGADLLLDRLDDATAVIVFGDSLALVVLAKARQRGLSLPRDLSVIGFDDIPESALSEPPLTTMAQPSQEIGETAARLLLDGGPPRQITMPVTLVVRGSTAPPRGLAK